MICKNLIPSCTTVGAMFIAGGGGGGGVCSVGCVVCEGISEGGTGSAGIGTAGTSVDGKSLDEYSKPANNKC